MQNNYFFLRELSRSIAGHIHGFTLVSCFTQSRDELIFEFNNATTSFFIRANLSAELTCLSFPATFARAGKNSLDLFPEIILKKVTGIRQFENERSFAVELEGDRHVVFKMHGSRANIIVFNNDTVSDVFRHHLTADLALRLQALDRVIDWSEAGFLASQDTLQAHYFTFGKQVWAHLNARGFAHAGVQEKWALLRQLLKELEHPGYYICKTAGSLSLLLFAEGEVVRQLTDPVRAVTEFYSLAIAGAAFNREKHAALQKLRLRIDSSESFLQKNALKLDELLHDKHYKVWADIIMANMHLIPAGARQLTAENFYNENKPIRIPLKPEMNAQTNAEAYYRKARNQSIEIQKLRDAMAAKKNELDAIVAKVSALEGEHDLRTLRKQISDSGLSQQKEKQPAPLPYREFEFRGFNIWVGRNAESNDRLTQKYSFKDDLWLHAKDVAGSHVLIKYQSGRNFPKDVIEYAAGLAAHFSKRKNESLCPVAFTQKKFVRKRKGDPAGTVVVEREEVMLVAPVSGERTKS